MDRKLLITIHMYLAAFLAPPVLLVAISGGLYLLGIKGEVQHETIYTATDISIDTESATLQDDVSALLQQAGVNDYEFEYVKVSGSSLYTRPTSTDHYTIKLDAGGAEVIAARPDLQASMMELHMGHGPTAFKTFQKVFALGLVLIMASGLWLGVSAARLRRSTLLTAGAGLAVFALLLF